MKSIELTVFGILLPSVFGVEDAACSSCLDVSGTWGGLAYQCQVCSRVPESLPVNLTRLGIDGYHGYQLTADDFRRYTRLEDIHLINDGPSVIRHDTLKDLIHLKRLFLSMNKIEHFPELPQSIEYVELQNNLLTQLPKKNFQNLRELMLDSNKLTAWPDNWTSDKLGTLSLLNNQIQEANLSRLAGLSAVDISRNRLAQAPELPGSVREALLSHNLIASLPPLHLDNLELLDLSYNNITYIDKGTFSACPRLHTLFLNGNPVAHIAPSELHFIMSLSNVRLPATYKKQLHSSRILPVFLSICLCLFVIFVIAVAVISSKMNRRTTRQQADQVVLLSLPNFRRNQMEENTKLISGSEC